MISRDDVDKDVESVPGGHELKALREEIAKEAAAACQLKEFHLCLQLI